MFTWLYNFKTAGKLAFGFGVCLLLAVVVGVVAITRMGQLNSISNKIVNESLDGIEALSRFQAASEHFRSATYRSLLADTSDAKTIADSDLMQQQSAANEALKDYKSTVVDPVDQQNYETLQNAWDACIPSEDALKVMRDSGHFRDAVKFCTGAMKTQFNPVRVGSSEMATWNQKRAEQYSRDAITAYTSACEIIVGVLVLAVLLGALIAAVIVRYMTKVIKEVSESLETLNSVCITNLRRSVEALEHGDLTVPIETTSRPLSIRSRDELGHMASTFNEMLNGIQTTIRSFQSSQAALSELVSQLQYTSKEVGTAASSLLGTSQQIEAATEEISATMQEVALASEQSARGAGEIAQGSSNQAASVNEGAELVKQLSNSVTSVAKDSATAQDSAEEARQAAQLGAASVRDTVTGMHAVQTTISASASAIQTLDDSSKQIGTIVQTIEEIAEQTNLLALNAAIEAARAGDAGRGFAVVADEVRKLAERSKVATQEIGDLIQSVQTRTAEAVTAMEGGVREVTANSALAERAGQTLDKIQIVVDGVTSRVQSICVATERMKSVAENVTRSISDVAAVIEQSSAAAEEMSASADEVSASVTTVATTTSQQSAAIEDLVGSASRMSDIAESLSDLIARFKTNAGSDKSKVSLLSLTSDKLTRTIKKAA